MNLVDLVFAILLKWRMIIVFMVIGALVFGGYSYWNNQNNMVVQESSSETLEEEIEVLPEVKRHVELVLEYEQYGEYYDKSLLMKIDGKQVPKTDLIFSVQTNDVKNKNTIVATYTRLLSTGMSDWLVQSGMNVEESAQVTELISIGNDNGVQGYSLESADKGTIYVTVIHIDEKQCKDLAERVKEFVESQKSIVDDNYGTHEISLVSEKYATVIDDNLLSKQKTMLTNAISERHNVRGWISSFSAEEKKYYDIVKDVEASEKDIEAVEEVGKTETVPSISIKYVILGMLLFVFGYIFFVFMIYILNNKLRVNDNLEELYNIPQLGVVAKADEKKKMFNFVDVLLIKLRDRNKRKFTKEESEEIVAIAIKMAVRKSEANEVSLVGCEVKKQTEDICNSIKEILEKEDIKVTILDNILYNAETLRKLESTKNAVLVEKAASTMYEEVSKEVELLQRNKINVLGGILVE